MSKILLSKAIKDSTLFMIDNTEKVNRKNLDPEYNLLYGRIRFLSLNKYRLSDYKFSEELPYVYMNNILIKLNVEYMNLNKTTNRIQVFDHGTDLEDLDGYKFEVISVNGFDSPITSEMYEKLKFKERYYNAYEIFPKMKDIFTLFYLVPDEETDYYFNIYDSKIEEI